MASPGKLLIIGAGPSGLMAAFEAQKHGFEITIIERGRSAGGLCKTLEFGGCRFDIGRHEFPGGGEIMEMWKEIVGDDHTLFKRNDAVYTLGQFFYVSGNFQVGPLSQSMPHPRHVLERIPDSLRTAFLASYDRAQRESNSECRTAKDYRDRLFGPEFTYQAFDAYSEKIFGLQTSEVLLSSLLPSPSPNLLKHCLHEEPFPSSISYRDAKGRSQVGFTPRAELDWYPALGAGMITDRMEEGLRGPNITFHFGTNALEFCQEDSRIVSVLVDDGEGKKTTLTADHYFCGLPLRQVCELLNPKVPAELDNLVRERMPSRDVIIAHLVIGRGDVTPHHFIEVFDRNIRTARVTNYKLWSPSMVASPDLTGLGMELYLESDNPLNQSGDEKLFEVFVSDCEKMGLCRREEVRAARFFRVKGVAPAEVVRYRRHRYQRVVDYLEALENFDQTYRQGQASAMLAAKLAVRRLIGEEHDVAGIL